MNIRTSLLICFVISWVVWRFSIAAGLPLAPDEAYYWYWSKHLDLSYYDHPPMVAYIMAMMTHFGGDTELFVRMGGFLLALCSLFLIALTIRTLFPPNPPVWESLSLFNVTLLFAAGMIIQTPDTPLLFFWSLAVYCGARIIQGGAPGWWYLWGLALGLGLLSKYTMILLLPCFLLFFTLSRTDRAWLTRKEPYVALIFALIIFSPVIVWNFQHDWLSFNFQLKQGFGPKDQNIILKLLEYLGGQAGVVTPFIFIGYIYYSAQGLLVRENVYSRPYLYLALLSWPVILLFALSSMVGKVAEANWPAPAYVTGIILTWAVYHHHFRNKKGHRHFMTFALAAAFILSFAVHIHLVHPFIPIPPKDDTTQQFHGWRELGEKLDQIILHNPSVDGYFILSDKGTTLAAAIFYTNPRYLGFDPDFKNRYLFLKDLKLQGKNAIVLLHQPNEAKLARYSKSFFTFKKIDTYVPTFRNTKMDHLGLHIFLGREYSVTKGGLP